MSAAFVLMITDGQDTQKRAGDLQHAGYATGLAWRHRADHNRKQAINGAVTRAPAVGRMALIGRFDGRSLRRGYTGPLMVAAIVTSCRSEK
jgi:hypothetical protein